MVKHRALAFCFERIGGVVDQAPDHHLDELAGGDDHGHALGDPHPDQQVSRILNFRHETHFKALRK